LLLRRPGVAKARRARRCLKDRLERGVGGAGPVTCVAIA
jgi:hypothetical protein